MLSKNLFTSFVFINQVSNSFATQEEIEANQRPPAQIDYEEPPSSVIGYPPPPPPSGDNPDPQNPHHYMPR